MRKVFIVLMCLFTLSLLASCEVQELEHEFNNGKIAAEATCTKQGIIIYTCTRCGFSYREYTEPLGHDLVHHEGKLSTENEPGWKPYDTCTRCDYTTYEEVINCNHTAGEIQIENRIEPTCELDGSYDEITHCIYCDNEMGRNTVSIPALGHDLVHHEGKDATCIAEGYNEYDTCTRCDYSTISHIAALGHNWSNWVITEATFIEDGYEERTCSMCFEKETVIIPAKTAEVEFDLNGGSSSSNIQTIHIHTLLKDDLAFDIIKENFKFIGWSYNNQIIFDENGNNINHFELADKMILKAEYANLGDSLENFEYNISNNMIVITGIKDKTVKEIIVPESVYSIEKGAFSGCSSLEKITLPFVGDKMHESEDSNKYPFGYIFGVDSYDGSVATKQSYIADYNSTNKYKSNTYYIPKNLKEVVITSGNDIHECAFENCIFLTNIEFPNTVKNIWHAAFEGCTSLTSIEIPDSVTIFGQYVFTDCTSLKTIKLSNNLTSLEEGDFSNCVSLEKIEIPNSVTKIFGCFDRCKSLSKLIIPNSVIYLELCCNGCTSLEFLYIPSSVKSIYACCYECSNLIIYCEASSKPIGWRNDWNESNCPVVWGYSYNLDDLDIFEYDNTDGNIIITGIKDKTVKEIIVPNNVNSIEVGAFSGCSSLEKITLPFVGDKEHASTDTYQYPFGYIFGTSGYTGSTATTQLYYGSSTSGLTSTTYYIPTSLKKVVITGSSYIPYGAFYRCTSLTSIYIPNSVTYIGDTAFTGCSSVESIVVDSNNTKYDSRNNCNAIIETSTNTLLFGCNNTIIPNSVTSIESSAFYNCTSLTSIEIPNSVTSIGDYAFHYCTSLTSIEIPNSVTYIGDNAFNGCSSLESIIVDSNNTKYDSRNNCNAIIETSTNTLLFGCKNTIIPNSVTSLESSAFYNCTSLTSIEIPNSVTSIGQYAFWDCTSLTSIEIPNSVTSIGDYAFYTCPSLTIYCEAESKPSDWNEFWNYGNYPVVWGLRDYNTILMLIDEDVAVPNEICGEINLPTVHSKLKDLTYDWSSDSEYIIIENGKPTVVLDNVDHEVKLTLTATMNGVIAVKEFIVVSKTFCEIAVAKTLPAGSTIYVRGVVAGMSTANQAESTIDLIIKDEDSNEFVAVKGLASLFGSHMKAVTQNAEAIGGTQNLTWGGLALGDVLLLPVEVSEPATSNQDIGKVRLIFKGADLTVKPITDYVVGKASYTIDKTDENIIAITSQEELKNFVINQNEVGVWQLAANNYKVVKFSGIIKAICYKGSSTASKQSPYLRFFFEARNITEQRFAGLKTSSPCFMTAFNNMSFESGNLSETVFTDQEWKDNYEDPLVFNGDLYAVYVGGNSSSNYACFLILGAECVVPAN